ncbi:MAG: acyl-CoA dehydratase activase, partial [bacterium]
FIVQQLQRMGLSLEQGLAQSRGGRLVQLASRCSVHCKSDATHKLNKGECTRGDIARTLIHDLAEKVGELVRRAQWPTRTLVLSGGVAENRLFVKSLREALPGSEVKVLAESTYLEAFGASLYASELARAIASPPREKWFRSSTAAALPTLEPLKSAEALLDYRPLADGGKKIDPGAKYVLGVDAGSTTTKAVLVNAVDGSVGASCYLRTFGNPVTATRECLGELLRQVGETPVRIVQAGVTGSGRQLVSVHLDNCPALNEILAHARAAAEEVPHVDTVFEIGGQDSKYISFLEGVPVDYAMNEGCSAGTGSFIEESAWVDMGVAMEQISDIAEASRRPIAFGERCAAFINTDLRNALQQGTPREDVIAGLAYSVAENYISRVVGARHIGENLLFLGGVALNRAVALAIAARTGRRIVVPPHPELRGSIGAALLVRDRLRDGRLAEKSVSLQTLARGRMEVKGTFRCKACANHCEIQRIAAGGKVYPFGGLCARHETRRQRGKPAKEGRDLVALRNRMMFEEWGPRSLPSPRGTIGLPMALMTFELFPFYAKLIERLGYEVVLSGASKLGDAKAASAVCYPCQIVHGAVHDLLSRNVDFILLPYVIEMEIPEGGLHGYTCPSTTLLPDLIRAAFDCPAGKILSPHIALSAHLHETTLSQIAEMGGRLGVGDEAAREAAEAALRHYQAFRKNFAERCRLACEQIRGEPAVILAGRPYITCSEDANLSLPRKITSRGYHVVPADMLPPASAGLPPRNVWHFTQQIGNAIAWAQEAPHHYLCFVSCFSCGPDSSMYHFFRQQLAGRTFCYLEIDSHTAHAGFETRLGAFLDIVEERHRKRQAAKGAVPDLPGGTVRARAGQGKQPECRPARLSEDRSCIVDSDGNRVAYDDPRVVHIWTADHSPLALRLVARVYEARGRRFRAAGRTRPETLRLARRVCSGRECLPMTAMAGAVLEDLQTRRTEDEISIYFAPDQEGPCQNGAWPLVWETLVRRLGVRNVISGVWPGSANECLGLGSEYQLAVNGCLFLGDLFEEARSTVECLAQHPEAALRAFEAAFQGFLDRFAGDPAGLESGLREWAVRMTEVRLSAPVEEAPKVLIIGGLNLLFVHEPVTRYFLEQGILAKVVPYSEGVCWFASEPVVRYGFRAGRITPREQFAHSPRGIDRDEAVRVRQSRFSVTLIGSMEKRLRDFMSGSGLLFDMPVPFLDVAEQGHRHASHIGFTETTVTTGRYLCSLRAGLYDGLVNLGAFNCQPAMNSQAIVRPLANASSIPYVAVDCEGPWLSAHQRRLLESVAVRARRVRSKRRA